MTHDSRKPRPIRRASPVAASLLAVAAVTFQGCCSYPDTRPTLALADRALAKAEQDAAADERPGAKVRKARASMFASVRAAIAEALKRGTGE